MPVMMAFWGPKEHILKHNVRFPLAEKQRHPAEHRQASHPPCSPFSRTLHLPVSFAEVGSRLSLLSVNHGLWCGKVAGSEGFASLAPVGLGLGMASA